MSYTINEYQNFECLPIRPSLVTMEKTLKWKPNKIELAPNCPRCASSNTKFCYYNNYSVSQPRYFCKSCRRYWTKGGSLRNVPVGGGCRKNRRHSRSTKQDGGATPTSTADGDGLIASSSSATRDVSMEFDGRLTRGNCDSGAVFEDQKEMDFLMNDHQVHDQCVDGQDLVYEGFSGVDEMEGIDLQGFDVLWPGVSQDAMGGLDHHFEMFASASDDQMRISANHDNWGWLDCEIFTRP